MHPHVLFERAGVGARVLALAALEVQHARVDAHVRQHLVLPRERLLANLAAEGLLACKATEIHFVTFSRK